MTFTKEQLDMLQTVPPANTVQTRRVQGREMSYLPTYHVLDEANRIFGFHSWSYHITRLQQAGNVWYCTMVMSVTTDEGEVVEREDVGVGIPAVARDASEATDDAIETAIKGAVSDATKRCLRTFGAAFGNSLYQKDASSAPAATATNKTQRQVDRSTGEISEETERTCPSCGSPMVFRSGTTRDGRPYSAYFCTAKCGQKPQFLADRRETR